MRWTAADSLHNGNKRLAINSIKCQIAPIASSSRIVVEEKTYSAFPIYQRVVASIPEPDWAATKVAIAKHVKEAWHYAGSRLTNQLYGLVGHNRQACARIRQINDVDA